MPTWPLIVAAAIALSPLAASPDEPKAAGPAQGASASPRVDGGAPAPLRRNRKTKAPKARTAEPAAKGQPKEESAKPCEEVKPCPID